MLGGKRGIKRLEAETGRVLREFIRRHERGGAEPTDVAIVEGSAVVERELHRGVAALRGGQLTRVDEQRTGKARLNDQMLPPREIEDDEFGAAPDVFDP